MTDDLAKRLWKGVADVEQQQDAADRIEELEAKLAKAVEFIKANSLQTCVSCGNPSTGEWCSFCLEEE